MAVVHKETTGFSDTVEVKMFLVLHTRLNSLCCSHYTALNFIIKGCSCRPIFLSLAFMCSQTHRTSTPTHTRILLSLPRQQTHPPVYRHYDIMRIYIYASESLQHTLIHSYPMTQRNPQRDSLKTIIISSSQPQSDNGGLFHIQ